MTIYNVIYAQLTLKIFKNVIYAQRYICSMEFANFQNFRKYTGENVILQLRKLKKIAPVADCRHSFPIYTPHWAYITLYMVNGNPKLLEISKNVIYAQRYNIIWS